MSLARLYPGIRIVVWNQFRGQWCTEMFGTGPQTIFVSYSLNHYDNLIVNDQNEAEGIVRDLIVSFFNVKVYDPISKIHEKDLPQKSSYSPNSECSKVTTIPQSVAETFGRSRTRTRSCGRSAIAAGAAARRYFSPIDIKGKNIM
jgi:hypothetical protein